MNASKEPFIEINIISISYIFIVARMNVSKDPFALTT
jgi:hypothetical protein